ncbi:MAG: nucleoside hydrolase [Spirochaetaceae bacterium]|nr:MAG: nucleoside hydrolase [Spirochaetaceae bacterium]
MKEILIDTDCGVDDAAAIGIALAHSEVNVLGITTVNGNVGVAQVTENVLRLMPVLGRGDIPVFRGASRPLIAQPHHAGGIHGHNGLGDVQLPDAGKTFESAGFAEGILRLAREHPGLTLVALGPLTNVAIALNLYPELEELFGEIVSMGGALGRGNITQYAEFNYFVDPESVQVVLESKVPLTVVTWDAAVKMAHSEEEIRALGLGDSKAGKLFFDMHQPVFAYIEKSYGSRMAMFPDPLTMAYVVNPSIAREELRGDLKMELTGSPRRGASVRQKGERVKLIMEIDKGEFQSILLRIRNLA